MNKIFIIAFIVFGTVVTAQTRTNLEQMFRLIDKSVGKIDSAAEGIKTISINFIGPSSLEILKPKIFESFSKRGYSIKEVAEKNDLKITLSLINCGVIYSDIEKDGFLGSVIINRTNNLECSATIIFPDNNIKVVPITERIKDIVATEEIKNLEDQSLPFTQGQIPQPSFFSNLFEPLIVVGTLISTTILFFTVRGK